MIIYRTASVLAVICSMSASAAELSVSPAGGVAPGTKEKAVAAMEPEARPRLSRADLPRLRKLDRAGVFAALGSFDDRGLAEPEFVARALDLLDPKRIPGLAEARQAGDLAQALDAVLRVCRGGRVRSWQGQRFRRHAGRGERSAGTPLQFLRRAAPLAAQHRLGFQPRHGALGARPQPLLVPRSPHASLPGDG